MPVRRASFLVPLLPLAVAAAWLAWRWDALPDSIAMGFGKVPGAGAPRAEFARKLVVFVGGIGLLFSTLAVAAPRWRTWEFLRVPEPAYWLAPGRRASTIARTVTLIEILGLGFASVLALDFLIVGESALAGRTAALLGVRTPILLGALSLLCYGWYSRPFVRRLREQRLSSR